MIEKEKSKSNSKPRPPLFRALGKHGPPLKIEIDGQFYQHARTIKHDSWAATALYERDGQRVVCKFNRIQPIYFISCRWLGRGLARREATMYNRLSDLPNISTGYQEVYADGQRLPNAVAHDYVEGHPLRWHDRVKADFFEQLRETLLEIHRRGIAYVDLNKCENIIVDESGDPFLIDFQISVKLPRIWPLSLVLRVLQKSDLYHLAKHAHRFHPGLYPKRTTNPPFWIHLHRKIANPFRASRRRLLTAVGVRKGKGKAQTELFVEEGLRASSGEIKPIIQLFELLKSPQYVAYTKSQSNTQNFIEVLFAELVGRAPHNEFEDKFVDGLKKRPIPDQVMSFLMSELFVSISQNWDAEFIAAKIRRVARKLNAGEPTLKAVA